MHGNTMMQMRNALQNGHDLLRDTGLLRGRFTINGKVYRPMYAEPMRVQYENLEAYKLLFARIDPVLVAHDKRRNDDSTRVVHERFVLVDKDWRKIQGCGVGFLYHPDDGWYFGRKKIYGYGDTLDKAIWLYDLRLKRVTLRELTKAA